MPFFNFSAGAVLAKTLALAAVVLGAATATASAAQGTVRVIATSGDPAPDGNGSLGVFALSMPYLISLNRSGQVAFTASLTGTTGGSTDSSGLFVGDGTSLSQIARKGQTAPDGNGSFSSFSSIGGLNDAGQIAFSAYLIGTTGDLADNTGIFLGDVDSLGQIAREGQSAPDGNGSFSTLASFSALNASGQVAFSANLTGTTGGSTDDIGLFVGDGTSLSQIAREGQTAPDGNGRFSSFSPHGGVNGAGQVPFVAGLTDTTGGGTDNVGVLIGDGTSRSQIAREGQMAPGGNGVFSYFSLTPSVGASGQVAFGASLIGTAGGATDNDGVFLGDGTSLSQVAREGQTAPDGNGRFSTFVDSSSLTESRQLAFLASLSGTTGGSADDSGIFRTNSTSMLQIVRKGQAAPNGNGSFYSLHLNPVVNEAGQVVFQAFMRNSDGVFTGNQGLYFFDDSLGLVEVARTGDAFLGSTITSISSYPAGGGRGGGLPGAAITQLNLSDRNIPLIAYGLGLADGRTVIALWTLVPEPSSLLLVSVAAVVMVTIVNWTGRKNSQS